MYRVKLEHVGPNDYRGWGPEAETEEEATELYLKRLRMYEKLSKQFWEIAMGRYND